MVSKGIDKPTVGQYLNCLDYLLYLRKRYAKTSGHVPDCLLQTLKLLEINAPSFVPNLAKLINDRYNR